LATLMKTVNGAVWP